MKLVRFSATLAFLLFFLAGNAQEQTTSQKKKHQKRHAVTQTTDTKVSTAPKAQPHYPATPEIQSGSSSDAKRNNNPCYPFPCESADHRQRNSPY